MKYSELPENPSPNTVLRCEACDIDYSATRRDYWDRLHETPRCGQRLTHAGPCCGQPLKLMQRVRSYRKVRKAS